MSQWAIGPCPGCIDEARPASDAPAPPREETEDPIITYRETIIGHFAASPAQEATPPWDCDCFDPECGYPHGANRVGHLSLPAAPTPEATASPVDENSIVGQPDHAELYLALCNGGYMRLLADSPAIEAHEATWLMGARDTIESLISKLLAARATGPLVLLTSREVYAKALIDVQVCDVAEAERRALRAFPARGGVP